nr:sensor histidine kinase [Chthonobacter albigriseus]
MLASGLVAASLLAAGLLVHDAQRRARATFETQLQETARALSLVVDGHLRLAAAFNAALASSPSLAVGDLDAFDAQARRALDGMAAWIVLSDLDGQQLVNTLRPRGTPLPADAVIPSLVEQLQAGRTVASDLMQGAVTGRPVLAVDSPVRVDGRIVYDLAYAFFPDAIANLLREQRMPEGWFGTVLDRDRRIIARTFGDASAIGRSATPDLSAAIDRSPEGVIDSVSLEGEPTIVAYSRLPNGWTVVVVVPRDVLAAGIRRSYILAAIGALGIIGLGGLSSWAVARGISGPIVRLSRGAEGVGRGEVFAFTPDGITETDAVGRALAVASARLKERERELADSLERQQLAFDAASIGTWDVDVAGGARFWSPEFTAIMGLPPETPPDPMLFSRMIHPDDFDRVTAIYDGFYAPNGPETYVAEFRITRADTGEERWVRTEGRIRRDANGRALRGTGTILDVTDQRRDRAAIAASEQRLRVAVASVPFPLMLETAGGEVLEASRSWWESSGQPESASTRTWAEAALAEGALVPLLAEPFGYAVPAGEARIRTSAGRERIWEVRAVPLDPLPDGRPLRLVAAVDVTERERDARRLGLLVDELNHRVKNTLAKVQAIASRTALTSRDPDEFVEKLGARLRALARTHDLLTERHWEGVPFRGLLDAELAPFTAGGAISLDGPSVDVRADIAVSLSLLLHELATNAVKHGCLAREGGKLEITWRYLDEADPAAGFAVDWRERCPGGKLVKPTTRGFGSRLIASTLASLGAGSVDYGEDGLACHMEVHLRA